MLPPKARQEPLGWPLSLRGDWRSPSAIRGQTTQTFVPEHESTLHESTLMTRTAFLRIVGCLALDGRQIPQHGPVAPQATALACPGRVGLTSRPDLRFLRGGALADTGGPPKAKAPKEFRDGPCNAAGCPPPPRGATARSPRTFACGDEPL
jgi:hypothetical protein